MKASHRGDGIALSANVKFVAGRCNGAETRRRSSGVRRQPASHTHGIAVSQVDQRQLRKDRSAIAEILQRLDAAAAAAEAGETPEARAASRYNYRDHDLVVWFEGQDRQPVRYAVVSRNISRGGISFLVGSFVYAGSKCTMRLIGEYNNTQTVAGRVARCRYIEGSGSVYEIGVCFDQPIDVAMFQREAETIRVLLVDEDPFHHKLIEQLLKPRGVKLTCTDDGHGVLELAETQRFDLILIETDLPEIDGLSVVRELRQRGYGRPIVAVSASQEPDLRVRCLLAGCSDFLAKPLSRGVLDQLVESLRLEPLVSSLADDAGMHDLIDAFAIQAPQRVGEMEASLGAGDIDGLSRLATRLKARAGACGFEAISESAADLTDAIMRQAGATTVREKLNQLSRRCLAARPVQATRS